MNCWWQLARANSWTLLATECVDSHSTPISSVLGDKSDGNKLPWLLLRMSNLDLQQSWCCAVYKRHFGSEKIVCEIWETRSIAVTFFGDTVFIVDLSNGLLLKSIDFSDELYVQDILAIPSRNLLLVSTAQSLHCLDRDFTEIWCLENVGVDGVSICAVDEEHVRVIGEDPGNEATQLAVRIESGKLL